MAAYTVEFEPLGRRGTGKDNDSVLACARNLGIGISSVCGGKGTCFACKVQLIRGTLTETTSSERKALSAKELKRGWRLACQAYPRSNLKLHIPLESMTTTQRVQVETQEMPVILEPAVRTYYVKLTPPSLSDTEADADRLLRSLSEQHRIQCHHADSTVLHTLSPRLREWDWECRAIVRNDEVIAVHHKSSRQLGLAIDLGTTKIAGYLVDLSNGKTLASKGIMNPQISYGEDVISRINNAIHSADTALQLQEVVVAALNKLAGSLCAENDAITEEIADAVIVGNTAMHHLLLNLPVKQLALSPFVPAVSRALDIKAHDVGIHITPGAFVHILPNIAGFVGADHVSTLLATDVLHIAEPTVILDIGTNTEISLICNGQIIAASCASGPAFEGGHIKNGMRAATGAIERIRILGSTIHYQTVNNAPPIGICGSGIVDALAEMYLAGIMDESGRINNSHPRVRTYRGQREFVLAHKKGQASLPAITITQQDVRELQVAKAAIRAGIQTLSETSGCREKDIRRVIIAGAFGSYIDIASAITVGLLPPLPLERFRQVGNAAGMGAKMTLVSLAKRAEAQTIASMVDYLELATSSSFRRLFTRAIPLGKSPPTS